MGWGEVRVSLAEGRVRRGGRAGRRVPLGGAPRVGGSGVGRVPLGSLSRPGALVRIQNSNCPELGRHVGRAVGGWGGGGGRKVGAADNGSFGEESAEGGGPATAAPAPLCLWLPAPAESGRAGGVRLSGGRCAWHGALCSPQPLGSTGSAAGSGSLPPPPSRRPRGGAEAAVPPCCCSTRAFFFFKRFWFPVLVIAVDGTAFSLSSAV